ncbi:putative germination-specific protease domain protein [[Clostridium] sordellii ATCC 9714]|nr:putative germination-specific protease domain protein [[Clostridium] sordellii ATCC 9714] [Paeniclostridium sordellii ATCC 9714]
MVEAGVRYAVEKAVDMNMPIVINFSLGSNSLTGATQSIIYEQPLFTRGLALVAAGVMKEILKLIQQEKLNLQEHKKI